MRVFQYIVIALGLVMLMYVFSALLSGKDNIEFLLIPSTPSEYGYAALAAESVALILITLVRLRKKYYTYVNGLIFAYALSLCVALFFTFAFFEYINTLSDDSTWKKLIFYWWRASLNPISELYFLAILIWFAVVPQILTYLLSGLLGCASRPLLIRQTISFISWLVIKGFTVASAFQLAQALFLLLQPSSPYAQHGLTPLSGFTAAGLSLGISACQLYLHFQLKGLWKEATKHPIVSFIPRVHAFMTRFRPDQSAPEPPLQDEVDKGA